MARKISVEIVGDASSLEKAFKKSSRSAKKFGGDIDKTSRSGKRAFGGLSRGVLGLAGGFIGTAGLVSVARTAFGEFSQAQKVQAQTAAALKSTGKAAGISAKQISKLATETLNLTGIDDEAVQSAENLLLTFTDVRGKVFKQAIPAITDLATAMNQGAVPSAEQLQKATLQLGKALNDPIKGITALSRVGIQFTKQQKDQIKALVESGQKAKAQQVILAELNKEVGGRAAAAGKTFAGQWRILTETLNNLSGELAAKLMPTIQKYLTLAVKWLSNTKNQKTIMDTVKAAADAVTTAVRVLAAAFTAMNKVTGSAKHTFELLLGLFIAFKALKLAAYIAKMATAMRAFAIASAAANAAGAGGAAGKAGKAGRFARFGRFARLAPLALGGEVVAAGLGAYVGAKGLQKLIGQAPKLITPGAMAQGVRDPITVHLNVDGKKIASATARHNENELARRRKQRAHQRKSRR